MFCHQCGNAVANDATMCLKCGALVASKIPNHLVGAILVTIFCCMPFGIAAIIYAAQVNSKLAGGDVAGAIASSNSAKKWMWWSFGLGLVINAIWTIAQLVALGQHA